MPDYEPRRHKLEIATEFGDGGILFEPIEFIDSDEEVLSVDPTYPTTVHKTLAIRINGYVVIPSHRLEKRQAKAYKELLPEALRRAGLLSEDEGIVSGPVTAKRPPLDGPAVDGDVQRLVVDLPSDGKAASRVEGVLQALGCSFRPFNGDGFATA